MKKKFLALVLTLAMVLSLLPATALATGDVTDQSQADAQVEQENEGTPSTNSDASETVTVPEAGKAAIGKKIYNSLAEAVQEAESGATIQLGKGTYSGNTAKPTEQGEGAGKSLTFIGAGTGETTWQIQATKQYGSDGWCDYSFKGSDRITFENMTVIGSVYSDGSTKANDTQGLTYINHITLKDCIFNGRADYWGYQSTTFENVIFNAPGTEASGVTSGNYSLWTYTGKSYTFKNCTFNSKSGKTVNVYRHYDTGYDIVVNFEDCTFNTESHSSLFAPNPVNVNDSTLNSAHKYVINFAGNTKTNGFSPIELTCSRLFCFGADLKGTKNNTGKTVVNFNGTTVWQDGKMVDAKAYHTNGVTVDGVTYDNGVAGANDSLYAEGYKDNAFTTTKSDLTFNPQDGKMHGTVTKKCKYCGNKEVTQETEEPTPVEPNDPNAPVWQTSKSKKATKLNGNYESKVTLSLPSAEENLATDVVLAMDVSWYTDKTLTAVKGLLNDLSKVQQETGANIKIGISMFKGCAVPFQKLVTLTPEKNNELQALFQGFLDEAAKCEKDTDKVEAVKDAVRDYLKEHFTSNYLNTGTNMPAGLLLAKQMLDQDTSVKAERKYMVLVSDGSTYLFTHGQDYTTAWSRHYAGTEEKYRGALYENNWRCGDFLMSNEASPADWTNWLESVAKLNESFTEYDYIWMGADTTCPKPIPVGTQKYLINGDTSIYQATAFYKEMQKTGYNCYYCYTHDSEDSYGRNALKSLNDDAHLIDAETTSTTNIFSGITKDIIYLLGTGSTVKDEIGSGKDNKGNDYNFDFVDKAEAMTLTVGKTTYVTKKVEATAKNETSRYLFVKEDVETANSEEAPYVLHYYQKGEDGKSNECFVWNINVPVSNFAPVALTYSVKLVNPKSASGTYGQYDADGSKKYSGLYTNNSATLYPKDSNKNWGIPENFLKPTVSYTVSGGSGGNHKPTVTIPDDVPTGLNGKDHYAYVVGYPDGLVYPQKNITRAEVATIFFRLLEDETREANMTKSNGYNDMKDGAWYTCAVSTLSKMGIIKGYEDGSFKPDASISRAEFAAIAARFDPDGDKTPATFSDVSSHWAKDEISIAANHGWIKGYEDGSFKPDQKITRAETMTLVNRVLKRLPETKDDLHKDMKTWPDNQNESAWFYLAVQEATNSHYQNLKKDGTHEKWESMRETRDWAALEK